MVYALLGMALLGLLLFVTLIRPKQDERLRKLMSMPRSGRV